MERFVDALTFNPSTPFADPAFFADFLAHVLPRLRTFPLRARLDRRLRRGRRRVCAGDLVPRGRASSTASASMRPTRRRWRSNARGPERSSRADLEEIQLRYARSGGNARFEKYVESDGAQLRYAESLREHIVFAQHNLATDGSFNEFHLVVVRHALAKYNRVLVYHAHQVVYESLVRLGFLALGAKESLRFTPHQKAYDAVPQTLDFYRRIR